MITSQLIKNTVLTLALAVAGGCATGDFSQRPNVNSTINLGDSASEQAHNISTEHAPVVGEEYPDRWIMAVRASDYEEEHEPWRTIDGNEDTHWKVSGEPPHPIKGGHWIDLMHNRTTEVREISIRWLGNKSYDFKIIKQPWSDATSLHTVYEGESSGQAGELESYRLEESALTQSIRIEFAAEEDEERGIREVRIGDLVWPESYPPASYSNESVVETIKRPFYVEFERFMKNWPQFNFKRPLADGGKARRIMNTDEFEGGHIDFDIEVAPGKQNWITLKIWEWQSGVMERSNTIALEAFIDDQDRNRRWFMPDFVSEKQNLNYVWYGKNPRPGRWVYAHYKLHKDVVREKNRVRLRLQGVGSDKRDHPMRNPAPPVYTIISHTNPSFNPENSD